tara:strand:- start:936 stop:1229 length:294 start_codon:yes stop_codon:yes gene_type:complete
VQAATQLLLAVVVQGELHRKATVGATAYLQQLHLSAVAAAVATVEQVEMEALEVAAGQKAVLLFGLVVRVLLDKALLAETRLMSNTAVAVVAQQVWA